MYIFRCFLPFVILFNIYIYIILIENNDTHDLFQLHTDKN